MQAGLERGIPLPRPFKWLGQWACAARMASWFYVFIYFEIRAHGYGPVLGHISTAAD